MILRLCLVLKKIEGKCKGKKIKRKSKKERKNEENFKFNKLCLYVFANSIYLVLSIIARLNNLKISKL